MDGYLERLTVFVEALEHNGHGTAIVSCRYGHEAHWPGPTNEYVPLHAGDLRDALDLLRSFMRQADNDDAGHPQAACPSCGRRVPLAESGKLRQHVDGTWADGWKQVCEGGGRPARYDTAIGHPPGCAGSHLAGISCADVTRLRAESEVRNALWSCPNSPSRSQTVHAFGHPKDEWTECLNGCGMTWARLRAIEAP